MSKHFLSLQNIGCTIQKKEILRDIHLDIGASEFISFLGPSGCGKTTLLNIIAGFNQPTTGMIRLNGQDITAQPVANRHFGMVFQSYALFPNLTVRENITFGLHKLSKAVQEERCLELLRLIDLEAHVDKKPHALSGGQQQRVALARALAPKPQLLLLDEPLSALDAKIRVQLRNDLRLMQKRLGIPVIMVTHDQEEAMAVSDRIVLMQEGQIAQVDTPENLYFKPNNDFVADFIGAVNFIDIEEWVAEGETAIRYEHFNIERANETILEKEDAIIFQVFDRQFMGAFYRLTLLHPDQKTLIYADIPYSEFHARELESEKYVSVSPKKGMMKVRGE